MQKLINFWMTILYFGIILISDTYYRLHLVPQADGTKKPTLTKVNRAQVYADHPKKEQRRKIKRFYGFSLRPQNINYQQYVEGYYNLYEPPSIVPEKGSWVTIRNFLSHIFGKMLPVALDYLRLLYVTPMQKLPIIVLVSEDRETGKTTFLRLLRLLLGDNMVVATNRMIRSRFNSAWSAKLVVAVDEALLNRLEDSETFKAIATADEVPYERKGCDCIMIKNYIHLIFCSNNLYDPLYIDPLENRYFVVEVPSFVKKDPLALDKMKDEIPAFGYYLAYEHQMAYPEAKSRLWFPSEAYETEALRRIKRASVPVTKVDVAEILLDLMDEHDLKEISMTSTDLQTLLQLRGFTGFRPSHIFKEWGLRPGGNLTYTRFIKDGVIRTAPMRDKGRFVTFKREMLEDVLNGR